jgi:hypothetical protein
LLKLSQKGTCKALCSLYALKGVINLQYADDTLLFLKHDPNSACHLKWLMLCFDQLLGIEINYNKSSMVPINFDEDEIQEYAKIFCCKLGSFHFKYLRVPLQHEKLKREDILYNP